MQHRKRSKLNGTQSVDALSELVICVDSCFRNIALPKSEYDVASKKENDVGYFISYISLKMRTNIV